MSKRLERKSGDKIIGGVCSGLAEHFNISITLVRVLFAVGLLFASFSFWLYIILWIVVPLDSK